MATRSSLHDAVGIAFRTACAGVACGAASPVSAAFLAGEALDTMAD